MYTRWHIYHRRLLSVPATTHCDLLPLIADNMSIETRLDYKYIAFYKSIVTSKNSIVKYVAKNKFNEYSSTMEGNMTHLIYKYNINIEDILGTSKKKMNKLCYQKWKANTHKEYHIHAHIIRELIHVKENTFQNTFSNKEFQMFNDGYTLIIKSRFF